jgi:hypothetical protein
LRGARSRLRHVGDDRALDDVPVGGKGRQVSFARARFRAHSRDARRPALTECEHPGYRIVAKIELNCF